MCNNIMCNTNIYNTHYMSTNPNNGQKNDKQMQTEETLKCEEYKREEYKREKVEVIECESDFEENIFLRDDTPYEKPKHYLDDDDNESDEECGEALSVSKAVKSSHPENKERVNTANEVAEASHTNEVAEASHTNEVAEASHTNEVADENEEKLLYAPIFLETSLPRKGWIQGCVLCNAKTSNTIFYLDDTYKSFGYMVYCCHFCKRAKEQNEELEIEYNDMILEYIDENKDKIYIKLGGRLPKNQDSL